MHINGKKNETKWQAHCLFRLKFARAIQSILYITKRERNFRRTVVVHYIVEQ